jgi:hypothetical protein
MNKQKNKQMNKQNTIEINFKYHYHFMKLGKPFGSGNYKEVESESARAPEAIYYCFMLLTTLFWLV